MTNTLPKMHICKNCGFMSTRGDLFKLVDGILQCVFCIEDRDLTGFGRLRGEAKQFGL